MSETKGPFDAVIYHLRGCLPDSNGDVDEYARAIRVLEAAGKVDKEITLTSLENTDAETDVWRDRWDEFCKIHALIESLPDKVEK